MKRSCELLSFTILVSFVAALVPPPLAAETPSPRFQKLVLSESFHSEGADAADFNRDGHHDIVSGPYWYEGPEFRTRHAYAVVKDYSIKGYSDHFFSFARDFNGDGQIDIFSIPMPGTAGVWYENPGDGGGSDVWTSHVALPSVDNESPTFADIDGDGIDELVCIHQGRYGYAEPDNADPTLPWHFTAVSDNRGYGRFTHGLGVGDVDGDGRPDLLEKDGWWQQTETAGAPFTFHPVKFAASGGSQMFAYDFDGDGDNDVLSVQNAHGYGLSWFERRGSGDDFLFVEHPILGSRPSDNPYGLAISQMHAVALTDIDGDGVLDIVTGKRFWAHGGNDPGASELPVLYWLRTARSDYGVDFHPHLIDVRVGVGTQLTTADIDRNGHVDVIVGNKLGTYVLLNRGTAESPPTPSTTAPHRVGSDEFKNAVRTTEPLTPEQEQQTFVLPAGFKVQLVAAEPEIAKPMNMAFDTRGRLWVSSSVEYPFPAADGEGRDTIKILEDTDADGRADKITTFADGLNIPIGLYPYRDGVICYSIPNIWLLRDTDGDDKCDTREILYGPFDYSRDTHGMCNGFTRGLDGWLYACHGFNNQSSVAGKDGHNVTMHSGNTFRIRTDGSRIEHFTDGQVNPFGMAIDPNGDLFTADCHTKPITLLMRGGVYEGFGKPHDGLGFVPNVMEHLHGSTAIGGIALYHDDAFPPVFHGNAFGGNVMTSRVNRNSIHHAGSTVSAREESDFMISGDPWFRPVDLQTGPDGALYVADFYNRIIGHYEVGLDHPGRDRQRGRIWRIVYDDDARTRRDVPAVASMDPPKRDDFSQISRAIEQLESANLTRRSIASDQLADQFGAEAIEPVRQALAHCETPDAKVHLLWVLHRLAAITDGEIQAAAQDENARVRSHAMQIIGASGDAGESLQEWLAAGLHDSDAMVRRRAAQAAAMFPSLQLTKELMETLHQTPASDPHLRHAIRMTLRDHLRDAERFRTFTASLPARDVNAVIDLCLGIKTDFAGEFLAAHVTELQGLAPDQLSTYLSFAARYASPEHLGTISQMAQTRFAEDPDFQEDLLRSIQTGLRQRGIASPPVVVAWATRLARSYLGIPGDGDALPERPRQIGWTYFPYPGTPDHGNPWVPSTKRNSADGEQASKLHSSFPTGESKTGIYRSDSFRLPEEFSFYLAGHDGFPDKPIQQLNLVRLRDAATQAVLQSWSPPRNDTAHKITWKSADAAGREVFVELVDGDTAGAYAWMAVGRFSVDGLNPSNEAARFTRAARLIGEFRIGELAGVAKQLVADPDASGALAAEFAAALVAFDPTSQRSAIAESLSINGIHRILRGELANVLLSPKDDTVAETLGKVTKLATAAEQLRIAGKLSSDQAGVETLLMLVEAGQASPRLLVAPAVRGKLDSLATQEQSQRISELTNDLPTEDQTLIAAMNTRKAAYLVGGGDAIAGGQLFAKQCAVCHQVAGKGVAVGPNLDGVGNRGLDRLIEDVLTPNRNIDAAFRASVVLTEDGQVYSGLIKRTDGTQLVIVDQTGKEINVAVDEIVRQKTVATSPMPANFHETLDEGQTRDLLAYLLSLTH
ncbi:FG-GAP-like repeat-containing protein [Stieleria sp. ICT_E10.1]|uniref:PVC-type heme-binding CxxCH protein n=1 Tax=Stieleria sedimenti TaxID=2976331 RepID=UPI0021808602|nr:PVC-type heme-binding CxxCH protein [Stieleria sedimenti]MCS7468551.1 FG-GAP-like repeat-containing protein [Stieleria sedimenti]